MDNLSELAKSIRNLGIKSNSKITQSKAVENILKSQKNMLH